MFLAQVINQNKEPYVVKKYVECCLKVGNKDEILKIVQTNDVYDPSEIRDFLIEAKLSDPMPLLYLCNRFN